MVVPRSRLVAEVMPQLKLRGRAANGPAGDLALTPEARGGIDAPRPVPELLVRASLVVEDDRVEIDLPSAPVAEDESRGQPRLDRGRVLEPEGRERRSDGFDVLARNDDVEVLVRPRLTA